MRVKVLQATWTKNAWAVTESNNSAVSKLSSRCARFEAEGAPASRRSTASGTCTPAAACRSNSAERAASSARTAATTASEGSYAALICGLDTASGDTIAHARPASSGAFSVCAPADGS